MANITSNSIAAGVGAGIKNEVFKSSASVMPRKGLIIATIPDTIEQPINQPILVTSAEDVAVKTGFGSMAHRLAIAFYRGSRNNVPVFLMLEAEPQGAVKANGTIAVTANTEHEAGEIFLYAAGKLYRISVLEDDTADDIGKKISDVINSDISCPVTSENVNGVVTLTAKSAGVWGNGITVAVNQRPAEGQRTPEGIAILTTNMTGGIGIPDLADDIELALGSGDSANKDNYTDIVHGYGADNVILDALSKYNGEGNECTGLYSRTVARPYRSLVGNTATGSEGLQAAMKLGDNRAVDRTNGMVCYPGSLTHPAEIAAEAMGYMAAVASVQAEGSYIGGILSGVDAGIIAINNGENWTSEYENRNIALRSGISPLIYEDGTVKLQNVFTFYHPSSIPDTSNCYRRMRDISITQNVLFNIMRNFKREAWQGFTVVKNKADVTNARSRAKARDIDDVKNDDLALIISFMSLGWLYDTAFSINSLKEPNAVQVRIDGSGFDNNIKLIYSGEGGIMDTMVYVDTSIAITL